MGGSSSTAAARFGLPFDLERRASGGEELGGEREVRRGEAPVVGRTSGMEDLRRRGGDPARRSAGRRSGGDTVSVLFFSGSRWIFSEA
jgi:hypothetical protein